MPFGPQPQGQDAGPDDEKKNFLEKHGTVIGIVVAIIAAGITFWAVTRGSSGTGSATNTANSPLAVPNPGSGGSGASFDPTALQAQIAAQQASLTSDNGWISWLTTKVNTLQNQVNTLSSNASSTPSGSPPVTTPISGGAGGVGGILGGSLGNSPVKSNPVEAVAKVNVNGPGFGNAINPIIKEPNKPVLQLRTF